MPDNLKQLLPKGPISAWSDYPDCDEEDDEWIVGVALTGLNGTPLKLNAGERPFCWSEIATVRGRKMAEALAAHLGSLP
jgi:hypothetical protein